MNLSEQDLQEENKHLELTINLLRKNISELAQDLYDNEQKQQEFKKYVWDTRSELDPTEMKTIMSNNAKEIDDLESTVEEKMTLWEEIQK